MNEEISKLDDEPDYEKIALNLINNWLGLNNCEQLTTTIVETELKAIKKLDEVNKPIQKLAKNNKIGVKKINKRNLQEVLKTDVKLTPF
ncbi:31296_t:CDS:2 [Gigaspora margarita]|uniref:31296_t:CDS:1 n=1 Tax=Gigaspora margarita TaxID=4874 RepID=A0ABM8W2M4_GIGMA|nr:31296_t:CDS:2 [Gigaspora margarita]